jgi:hypothetical protein
MRLFRLGNKSLLCYFLCYLWQHALDLYFNFCFHDLGFIIIILACLIKSLSMIVSRPYTSLHLGYSRV